jgi:hypothetical protein
MDKRTAIKVALCILAAVASTSAVSEPLGPSAAETPTGDVWPSHAEKTYAPLRATAPRTADVLDAPPGNVFLPTDEVGRDGKKTSPSEIKLDITLTIRCPHAAAGKYHALRICR